MKNIYPHLCAGAIRIRKVAFCRTALVIATSFFLQLSTKAQNRFAVRSGSWTDPATWSATSNGNGGASVPSPTDNVTIRAGIIVTLPSSSFSCATLRINDGTVNSQQAAVLQFGATAQLSVNGAVTMGGGAHNRPGHLNMAAGGTIECSAFSASTGAQFTPGAGTVRLKGTNTLPSTLLNYNNLVIDAPTTLGGQGLNYVVGGRLELASASLSMGGSNLSVGQELAAVSGVLSGGPGTLSLSPVAPMTLVPGLFSAYPGNLVLQGTFSLGEAIAMNSSITLNSGSLDLGDGLLSRASGTGSFTINNGATLRSGGQGKGLPSGFTYTFSAGSNVHYYGDEQPIAAVGYGLLTLSGGTKALSGNTSVDSTFQNDAFLDAGTHSLTLGNSWTGSGSGSFGAATLIMAGTRNQTVPGLTLGNLTIQNTSAPVSAAGPVSVNGTLRTLAGSSFNLGVFPLQASAIVHAGTLLTNHTGQTPLPAGRTWGGTVVYNGAGPQNVVSGSYANLNVSGGSRVFADDGTTFISGTLTPGSGAVTLTGSTLNFNGAGAQSVPAWRYHNLVISGTRGNSSVTLASGTLAITGSLSLPVQFTTGSIVLTSPSTIAFEGTGAQTVPAHPQLTYQSLRISNTQAAVNAGGSFSVSQQLTIDAGAVLDMGTNALSGMLSGIVNNGTIRTGATTAFPNNRTFSGTGLVDYNGAGTQNIINGTYHHLAITGTRMAESRINLPSAGTLHVRGDLTLSAVLAGSGGIFTTNGNTISLIGTDQNISVTAKNGTTNTAFHFNGLNINGGGRKTLLTPVTVSGSLGMQNGILVSTAQNLLTMDISSAPSGGSNRSYVEGPLRKIGNSAFVFPIGKEGIYAPINMNGLSNTYGDFVAEYFRASALTLSGDMVPPIVQVSNCEYWMLQRQGGAARPKVSLSWDASSSCTNEVYVKVPSDMRIARLTNDGWAEAGTSGGTGTAESGSVQSDTQDEVGSYYTLATVNRVNPLPMKFLWVRAQKRNDGLQVEWETATEVNVSHYEIERSADGRSFTTIASVPVRVNNGGGARYQSLDRDATPARVYYRIKGVDQDGKLTFSNVIRYTASDRAALSLYPNPIRGSSLVLQSANLRAARYQLVIYDGGGRMVYSEQLQHPGGIVSRALQLPASLLPGAYYLQLHGDDLKEQISFLIQ